MSPAKRLLPLLFKAPSSVGHQQLSGLLRFVFLKRKKKKQKVKMTKKKPNVVVNGAFGKLGLVTCQFLKTHPDFNLVAQLGRQDNLADEIRQKEADIVIELTNAEAVYSNSQTIIDCNAHPVIGASGLKADEIQQLQARCKEKKLGGIIAPNFSVGAVMMMKLAQMAAKVLPNVEIIETHHQQKIDAPSGTALKTAELISQSRTMTKQSSTKHDDNEARGLTAYNIPIHAVRLPGFVAKQEVLFGNLGEQLTISHQSINRESFMPGVELALKQVISLNELVYGLDSFI